MSKSVSSVASILKLDYVGLESNGDVFLVTLLKLEIWCYFVIHLQGITRLIYMGFLRRLYVRSTFTCSIYHLWGG